MEQAAQKVEHNVDSAKHEDYAVHLRSKCKWGIEMELASWLAESVSINLPARASGEPACSSLSAPIRVIRGFKLNARCVS